MESSGFFTRPAICYLRIPRKEDKFYPMSDTNNKKPVPTATRVLNAKIGGRIRDLRKASDVTQADLARGIGYAQANTISYMESGMKLILAADLARIAEHLGVTVRALFPRGSAR